MYIKEIAPGMSCFTVSINNILSTINNFYKAKSYYYLKILTIFVELKQRTI